MKIIVGIGNPGKEYIYTRHNIGFQILDRYTLKHKINFSPAKSNFWYVESKLLTFPFFLIKPTTYVNNSGIIVKEIVENFDCSLTDLLVIYDDVNLDTGLLRIRKSGGDGGHNGIKSIIYHLNSDNFTRLRVGVSSPDDNDLSNYVLSQFSDAELNIINEKHPFIEELIEQFIIGGSDTMLDYFSKESNIKSS